MECSDCKGIERLVKAPPGRLNGSLVIEKGCRWNARQLSTGSRFDKSGAYMLADTYGDTIART